MSKLKVTLVAMLTTCAFATAAVAAQAHEYKIEEVGITTAALLETGERSGGPYVLLGTPFGVATHIECAKVSVGAGSTIEPGGESTSTLQFSGCTATKPAHCLVKEPIVVAVEDQLIGTPVQDEFSPPAGTPFTEITLTSKPGETCSLNGKPFKVEGTQTCEMPEAGSNIVAHVLKCTTAGSALTAGGKEATFSGTVTNLELKTKENWSAT